MLSEFLYHFIVRVVRKRMKSVISHFWFTDTRAIASVYASTAYFSHFRSICPRLETPAANFHAKMANEAAQLAIRNGRTHIPEKRDARNVLLCLAVPPSGICMTNIRMRRVPLKLRDHGMRVVVVILFRRIFAKFKLRWRQRSKVSSKNNQFSFRASYYSRKN